MIWFDEGYFNPGLDYSVTNSSNAEIAKQQTLHDQHKPCMIGTIVVKEVNATSMCKTKELAIYLPSVVFLTDWGKKVK